MLDSDGDVMTDFTEFPDFTGFDAQALQSQLEALLVNYQQLVDKISSIKEPTWKNLVIPLDNIEHEFEKLWSPIRHLNSVTNSDGLRDVYNDLKAKISNFYTQLGQNQSLYLAYKNLAENASLNKVESKIIEDNLLSFKLSGVSLETDKQTQFKDIQKILSKLSTQFSENVLDSTEAWSKLITDKEQLNGVPAHIVELTKNKAQTKNLKGWLLTLDFPIYFAVISYANNAQLRETLYQAYSTRASADKVHDTKHNNSLIINQLLDLKNEKAKLLGYKSYAELSVVNKMAKNPEQVKDFLQDLAKQSISSAKNDLTELKDFAKKHYNKDQLNAWDISYYSEKLKESLFSINDEMLQSYFPQQKVLKGLFTIVNKLYDIKIQQVNNANVWHDDVLLYKITDNKKQTCGYFYLDMYTREGKRGGAWMDECSNRINIKGKQHYAVAYLTCNLTPPIGDKPALFTHDEVVTLFHEFGHGLHHMLSKVNYPSVAGINGVEWDAVELPSQFMENWCWEEKNIALISGHYETNEPLPKKWLNALIAAKNFQSALQMLRQIEFSLFDMEIHSKFKRGDKNFVQKTLDEVRNEYSLIIPPTFNKFQNSFSHIFAGGYSAGYYSYKWAEVLSADAFAAFEEAGLNDIKKVKHVGKQFLQNILQKGGSQPALELFIAFRGREPKNDALLKHSGIL